MLQRNMSLSQINDIFVANKYICGKEYLFVTNIINSWQRNISLGHHNIGFQGLFFFSCSNLKEQQDFVNSPNIT